mmetsp:Transcript_6330/g.19098  ORF Transcript_6330/g.19098 Transcript_6330/m.19098 type:complete len:329 (+) Transcript_6330:122-1108(+)
MASLRQYASAMLGRLRAAPATPEEEGPGLGIMVNSRGARLQTKVWLTEDEPRGLVIFCHGYSAECTHNAAWQRVAKLHTANGLVCAGIDYMGHGRSEGARLHVESFDLLVDDVLQFVDELRVRYPHLPIFIRGQSMGGLLGVLAALRRPELFQGLALGAPAFELSWNRYALLRLGGLFLGSSAPTAILAGQGGARQQLSGLTTPIAVFQGVEDDAVSPVGARHLITGASAAKERALYLYQDMGHNMSIEPDVIEWVDARLGGSGRPEDEHLPGATLHVRSPVAGAAWQLQPPGSAHANANTQLETVRVPAQQGARLDALLGETGGVPL